MAAALEKPEMARGPVVVMYLDLDGFKGVNDRLGHAAGDSLLRQVADRLTAWAQPGTLVARLGGDEFAILRRTSDPAEVAADAQAIIDSLGRSYEFGMGECPQIGVSIGLATGVPGDAAGTLLRADRALYAAKGAGRATFRWEPGHAAPEDSSGCENLHTIGQRMRESAQAVSRQGDKRTHIAG